MAVSISERLSINLENRKGMIRRLRAEIVGPDPQGVKLSIMNPSELSQIAVESQYSPRQRDNGEEILWQDPPHKRYGAGILYPPKHSAEDELESSKDDEKDEIVTQDPIKDTVSKVERDPHGIEDADDFNINLANSYKPSAIGLSFLADLNKAAENMIIRIADHARYGRADKDIEIRASATYFRNKYYVIEKSGERRKRKNNEEDLIPSQWVRIPFLPEGRIPEFRIPVAQLLSATLPIKVKNIGTFPGGMPELQLVVISRLIDKKRPDWRLITVSLVNRSEHQTDSEGDLSCLYQAGISVSSGDTPWIMPYPEESRQQIDQIDVFSERKINRLLYRQEQAFAIGHGCAADWMGPTQGGVSTIWTDVMPMFETKPPSTDLKVKDLSGADRLLQVSMHKLAGLDPEDDGFKQIDEMVSSYEKWIADLESRASDPRDIPVDMAATSVVLIERCKKCLVRIRDGLSLIKGGDPRSRTISHAFKLANEAMLMSRCRSEQLVTRSPIFNQHKYTWDIETAFQSHVDWGKSKGFWRPFQIAFLLMSIRGIVEESHEDRETVDLIWFPTGGGKTEAYLGVAAFTIFYNRLSGRTTSGVDVLMRYTLRLLTAQQFQRAALLFCSMEMIRKSIKMPGDQRFELGLWVGGETTPNTRTAARQKYRDYVENQRAGNPFILLRCPWCGAKFDRIEYRDAQRRPVVQLFGYVIENVTGTNDRTVVFRCPDSKCEFGINNPMSGRTNDALPVCVIDEDLIARPPRMMIGTVDKFAMLAWNPDLRSLFGIDNAGQHTSNPPTLIIQDELHLISGPLGSMVGAYETVVESMCRHHGNGDQKPKIVASTATICNSDEQIRSLYARTSSALFPPSGLESEDSFFSKIDKDADGNIAPGRIYLGILAPGHGSLQTTQTRTFSAAVQYPESLTNFEDKDPWWTLLCYYNAIRELGGAQSLFVSDVKQYLKVIQSRRGDPHRRVVPPPVELTSRISSSDVPKELEKLEEVVRDDRLNKAVDVCLASNIIEVGVDVPRLALMAIVGQPKTTSQYIQVSSRVGRKSDRPGLVLMIYGQGKPRDRSHYERFKQYHQKLYSHVEPTSVTPFSLPAIERALHGIIISMVRQLSDLRSRDKALARPFPLEEADPMRKMIEELLMNRVEIVDPEMKAAMEKKFAEVLKKWKAYDPLQYGNFGFTSNDPPLIYQAGSYAPEEWKLRSFATMTSLRNVDASCEADVTRYFNSIDEINP